MLDKRAKRYLQSARSIFSTPDGLYVLKCLKEDFVDISALSAEPTTMAYKIGQKELIQDLILSLKLDEEIENIETGNYDI